MLKQSIIFLSAILILCFGFSQKYEANTPDKYALLIGISQYPKGNGWSTLAADNDLLLLEKILMNKGFDKENIYRLQNESATKQGIIDAFNLFLIEQSKSGDIVHFHFSGHGQQVLDRDNDDEPDGYDEALVPYDSPKKYLKGIYEGERLLVDDEINILINKLRAKLGPKGQVFVTLDACHSGTGTKGMAIARGTNEKMAPLSYVTNRPINKIFETNFLSAELENNNDQFSPLIVFSGSGANQLNYEVNQLGTRNGALSFALSKAFSNTQSQIEFSKLFTKVREIMAVTSPNQIPFAEGDLNQIVFNNEDNFNNRYFKINSITDNNFVEISGGLLSGITPGSTIGFYQSDVKYPTSNNTIFTGTVINSFPLHSIVEIKDQNNESDILMFAYPLRLNYQEQKVGVQNLLEGNDLKDLLSFFKGIKWEEHCPELFLEYTSERQDQIILSTLDNIILFRLDKISDHSKIEREFNKAIRSYNLCKQLKELEFDNPRIDLKLDFIGNKKYTNEGRLYCNVKEQYKMQFRNEGQIPVYYSLIDIRPNLKYGVVIPTSDESPENYFLKPNESITLAHGIWEINEPVGLEFIKIIASSHPISLKKLIMTDGLKSPQQNNKQLGNNIFNAKLAGINGTSSYDVEISTMIIEIR